MTEEINITSCCLVLLALLTAFAILRKACPNEREWYAVDYVAARMILCGCPCCYCYWLFNGRKIMEGMVLGKALLVHFVWTAKQQGEGKVGSMIFFCCSVACSPGFDDRKMMEVLSSQLRSLVWGLTGFFFSYEKMPRDQVFSMSKTWLVMCYVGLWQGRALSPWSFGAGFEKVQEVSEAFCCPKKMCLIVFAISV